MYRLYPCKALLEIYMLLVFFHRYFVIDGIRNVPTWKEVAVEGTISPGNNQLDKDI